MVDHKSSQVMKALMHPLEDETRRCTTGTIPPDGRKVLVRRHLDGTRRESGHAEISTHKQHPSLVRGIKQAPAARRPSNIGAENNGLRNRLAIGSSCINPDHLVHS